MGSTPPKGDFTRCPSSFRHGSSFGGAIRKDLVGPLCKAIAWDCTLNWSDDPFVPEGQSDLEEALDENGHMVLTNHEAPWGKFELLEQLLIKYGIAFDRYNDACAEDPPDKIIFRPGMNEPVWYATNQGGNVTIDSNTGTAVIALIEEGRTDEAVEKLRIELGLDVPELGQIEFGD